MMLQEQFERCSSQYCYGMVSACRYEPRHRRAGSEPEAPASRPTTASCHVMVAVSLQLRWAAAAQVEAGGSDGHALAGIRLAQVDSRVVLGQW